MKKTVVDSLIIGFALFSMFFGAGNVIFPPYLGLESGPQWEGALYVADVCRGPVHWPHAGHSSDRGDHL